MSNSAPSEVDSRWPWGLRRIVRWSEKSLAPRDYWGDRYDDVLYERVDGFLSGVLVGVFIGATPCVLLLLVVGR